MNKYEILSFHPGRQHNFEQANQIQKFFKNFKHLTSLYFDDLTIKKWQAIHPKIAKELKRRSSLLDRKFVDTNASSEIQLLIKQKLGRRISNSDFINRNSRFQKWVIKNYNPPKILIGYDTSSWLVFEKWKGKTFLILDLSIAVPHYKVTLGRENGLDLDFQKKLTVGDEFLYDIYEKELNLADLVLCGSEFVKKSCLSLGVDERKLFVLPYGADLKRFNNTEKRVETTNEIKIVFVGSVSYRKGANVLLEAWQRIYRQYPDATLHFYGGVQIDLPKKIERVYFHGHVDQEVLINELKSAHISVLPSFFEGSSLAIYQSMAMRLAVITTPNSGSIIKNEEDGIIISYGSVEELTSSMGRLIEDKKFRQRISNKACEEIKAFTWDAYGLKLKNVIDTIKNQGTYPIVS